MIDQSHTVTIDRAVGEVFDFVAQPSNEPKWHFDVREVVRPKQGPIALGTTYEWIVRFLGTKTYVGEVTAFEPNRFIEMTTLEGPVLPQLTHTFQAEGDRTIYTRRIRFEPRGLFKVMEPLIKRMPSPNARWAENLKLVLEGGQPQ
jgi:ligand-binding SRPBCC domain-containing protein